jgi:hypothetical protein
LSSVLDHREQLGDVQGVEVLRQISPVAWQHINLYGRYEFRKFSDSIDLDAIVQQLTHAPGLFHSEEGLECAKTKTSGSL